MREIGLSLSEALALPWPVGLLLYDQLDEMRDFRDVRGMGERLAMASLTATAFHEPRKLSQEAQRYERLAGLLPSVSDTKAKGLAILNADREARGLPPLKALGG